MKANFGIVLLQKIEDRDLQCNELNRGHPRFSSQSQGEFRTKESEFVRVGPNTNERSNLTGNRCERQCESGL